MFEKVTSSLKPLFSINLQTASSMHDLTADGSQIEIGVGLDALESSVESVELTAEEFAPDEPIVEITNTELNPTTPCFNEKLITDNTGGL